MLWNSLHVQKCSKMTVIGKIAMNSGRAAFMFQKKVHQKCWSNLSLSLNQHENLPNCLEILPNFYHFAGCTSHLKDGIEKSIEAKVAKYFVANFGTSISVSQNYIMNNIFDHVFCIKATINLCACNKRGIAGYFNWLKCCFGSQPLCCGTECSF